MKAYESVENYDSRIREYANYSYRQSRNVCKNIGKREAGSKEENDLLLHVKNELETCADTVETEQFKFQKDTKIIQNKVGAIFFICAAALTIVSVLLNVAFLSACGIVAAVAGIILSFAGKIYAPKKLTSSNVYAVKKPSGGTKKRIIFVSNPDCVRMAKLDSAALKILSILSGVAAAAVGAIFMMKPDFADGKVSYMLIAVAVTVIFDVIILFSSYTGVLDGANKNLSGIFTSVAVLKYFKDMSIDLGSTEIVVVVAGAHEAGLSGAKYFAKNHAEQFKDNAKVICLDCLREEKNLRIESKNADSQLAKELGLSAKEAGFEIKIDGESYLSDADAFAKNGFDSCTLTACGENFKTEEDTYEDMKIKTIETALKTIMQEAFFVDENC
ncbi:MAG: M28 family peptidase [Clostridia bacterium]|nr:M28 family peptidase [Clostridia bacterium]